MTSRGEVIFYPRKSTRPLSYGYMKMPTSADALKVANSFKTSGFSIYEIDRIEWDAERMIGGRPVEDS